MNVPSHVPLPDGLNVAVSVGFDVQSRPTALKQISTGLLLPALVEYSQPLPSLRHVPQRQGSPVVGHSGSPPENGGRVGNIDVDGWELGSDEGCEDGWELGSDEGREEGRELGCDEGGEDGWELGWDDG